VHIKKHLGFPGLRKMLSKRFLQVEDARDADKTEYRLHDFFMTGFAIKLEMIFSDYLHQLQKNKYLEHYQFLDGRYLIPIDGSQYFSSKKICCTRDAGRILVPAKNSGTRFIVPSDLWYSKDGKP